MCGTPLWRAHEIHSTVRMELCSRLERPFDTLYQNALLRRIKPGHQNSTIVYPKKKSFSTHSCCFRSETFCCSAESGNRPLCSFERSPLFSPPKIRRLKVQNLTTYFDASVGALFHPNSLCYSNFAADVVLVVLSISFPFIFFFLPFSYSPSSPWLIFYLSLYELNSPTFNK